MKHIGIITELNPFHNGHAYIIDAARTHFPDKQSSDRKHVAYQYCSNTQIPHSTHNTTSLPQA